MVRSLKGSVKETVAAGVALPRVLHGQLVTVAADFVSGDVFRLAVIGRREGYFVRAGNRGVHDLIGQPRTGSRQTGVVFEREVVTFDTG